MTAIGHDDLCKGANSHSPLETKQPAVRVGLDLIDLAFREDMDLPPKASS